MIDLSQLSDADFKALQSNNLAGMSDEGFAVLLKSQAAARSPAERYAIKTETAREEYDPTKSMSGSELLQAGFGKAVTDIGRGVSQLAGQTSREQADEAKRLDAPLMQTKTGRGGNLAGNIGMAGLTSVLPGGQSVAGSTAYGGLLGLLEPVGTEDSRWKNGLAGAGGGFAGAAGANVLSRMLSPKVPADAMNLMDKGVNLTIGQRLGGGFKRAEDGLTSIPVIGDFVKNAQRRSIGDFNTTVANEALAPINAKLPPNTFGRDAVAYTEKAIGDAYDSVLGRIKSVQADSQFGNEINSLQTMVHNSPLPPEVQKQFDQVVKNQIAGKLQGQNTMTAQTFKDAESELGRLAAKYQADASADKQLLGDALQEAQSSLRSLLERSAGPEYAADVKAANQAWAQFKRMQRASTFLGAEDGMFSPANYLNAVKSLDRSKDKAAFARGSAMGQDLASDAVRVMGQKVPDSGTPFRSLMTNPLQGGVSAIVGSPIAALYSKPVQNLLQIMTSKQRPPLARLTAQELEMLAPLLGSAGTATALTNRPGQ